MKGNWRGEDYVYLRIVSQIKIQVYLKKSLTVKTAHQIQKSCLQTDLWYSGLSSSKMLILRGRHTVCYQLSVLLHALDRHSSTSPLQNSSSNVSSADLNKQNNNKFPNQNTPRIMPSRLDIKRKLRPKSKQLRVHASFYSLKWNSPCCKELTWSPWHRLSSMEDLSQGYRLL